jgi:hypothetical protein
LEEIKNTGDNMAKEVRSKITVYAQLDRDETKKWRAFAATQRKHSGYAMLIVKLLEIAEQQAQKG